MDNEIGDNFASGSASTSEEKSSASFPVYVRANLCDVCKATLTGHDLGESFERDHHTSLENLLAASKSCHFCRILQEEVCKKKAYETLHARKQEGIFRLSGTLHPDTDYLRYSFETEDKPMMLSLLLFIERLVLTQELEQLRLSRNIGSDTNFNIATKWIENCLKHHKECNVQWNKDASLPTRLIDIKSCGNNVVQLVNTSYLKVRSVRYATLSHCWGTKPFFTLTRETKAQLEIGLPVSNLPNTFQHAIIAARKLGIDYLWIDSLCIIQDYEPDWQREIKLMGDVYRRSHINLAATNSPDSEGGLFHDRNVLAIQRYPLELRIEGVQKTFVAERDGDTWQKNMEESPLLRRAWVVQERFLAPRVLHFAAQQMIWECKEEVSFETHSDPSVDADELLTSPKPTANRTRFHGGHREDHLRTWDNIRREFMYSKIKYETDRLPALVGIAREFEQRMGSGGYFAGMWEKDLEKQLMWIPEGPGNHRIKEEQPDNCKKSYVAPSWSWINCAGAMGMVKFIDLYLEFYIYSRSVIILCRVLEVSMDLVDSTNPFGQVKGGYMQLKGYLKACSFRPGVEINNSRFDLTARVRRGDSFREAEDKVAANCEFDYALDAEPGIIFLLHVAHKYHDREEFSRAADAGLILKKNGSENHYTRIGVFWSDNLISTRFLRRQARKWHSNNDDTVPRLRFERKEGKEYPIIEYAGDCDKFVDIDDDEYYEDLTEQTIFIY